MRWLLTGATGFIGLTLAERLRGRGHAVRGLARASSRVEELLGLGVELRRGDVTDPRSLEAAVDGCEVVVHLAGLVKALGPEAYRRVNALGSRHLAAACAAARPRPALVLVSSLAAAGPSRPGRPRREEDPPEPVSDYGRSKLEAEQEVRALAGRLEASVVRPALVYGPRDRELLPPVFRMARLGVVLKAGFADKRYSLLHVEDLADGIIAAAERGRRLSRSGSEGIYFLADGAEHRWEDLARAAGEALGARAWVVPVPEAAGWLLAAGGSLRAALTGQPVMLSLGKLAEIRQAAWTCAIDRAVRELAFQPRFPLREGMRQSAEWFRAHRLL
ncbi:MAG TPA: NAD-dependent epimerase/dehydratase family protein [Anaeromyxobacteraceae bacterium]|nr:NAD-dependent epimerase/dehydratase family protein [Anaeromyxobacteraceae bacterium]